MLETIVAFDTLFSLIVDTVERDICDAERDGEMRGKAEKREPILDVALLPILI